VPLAFRGHGDEIVPTVECFHRDLAKHLPHTLDYVLLVIPIGSVFEEGSYQWIEKRATPVNVSHPGQRNELWASAPRQLGFEVAGFLARGRVCTDLSTSESGQSFAPGAIGAFRIVTAMFRAGGRSVVEIFLEWIWKKTARTQAGIDDLIADASRLESIGSTV